MKAKTHYENEFLTLQRQVETNQSLHNSKGATQTASADEPVLVSGSTSPDPVPMAGGISAHPVPWLEETLARIRREFEDALAEFTSPSHNGGGPIYEPQLLIQGPPDAGMSARPGNLDPGRGLPPQEDLVHEARRIEREPFEGWIPEDFAALQEGFIREAQGEGGVS